MSAATDKTQVDTVHSGSGNVFKDLGLSEPKKREAKARLALHIQRVIADVGLKQSEAAAKMGLKQPDVSNILKGKLSSYSIERLMDCLAALDQEVTITVKPVTTADHSAGRVIVA